MLRSVLIAVWVAVVAAAAFATPAKAEWRRAESERFIVYSDGGESSLRDYVVRLERFDRLLRLRFNLPLDEPVTRKLPIYLVRRHAGLEAVRPGLADGVAGFYMATGEDIFAIAIRDVDDDTLLHEYAHHFMFQNMRDSHPAWLIEGFAEFFMTAEFRDDQATFGNFNENRAYWLVNGRWPTLEEMLTRRPGELRGERSAVYYSVAWLMTHWFLAEPDRIRQLSAYVEAIRGGQESVAALETATGLTPETLNRELRRYMRGRITYHRLAHEFPAVEMEIIRLPASADDLLLIGQRLKIGVPDEDREAQAVLVRRAAAPHGDDPFAQLTLGHAELHFGDAAAGERILIALLEREPGNVEALQLMATRRMRQAYEAEGDPEERMGQARGYLARAYRVDDANYHTLLLIARTRTGAANYPNDNDMATWLTAFELAPQLAEIRLGLADALGLAGRFEEAVIVLEPLANAPHGGPASDAAEVMLLAARAGRTALDAEAIKAIAEQEAQKPPEEAPETPGEASDAEPSAEGEGPPPERTP